MVKGDSNGQTYTRDGSFRFDKEGWLTNLNGNRVQAYQSTPDGHITGKITDIRIPYNTIPAKATNKIELHMNLDARMPISQPLDLLKPEETAQFTTGIQVFDSIGNARPMTVYRTRRPTAPGMACHDRWRKHGWGSGWSAYGSDAGLVDI